MRPSRARRPGSVVAPSNVQWPFVLLCMSPLLYYRVAQLLGPKPIFDYVTYWAAGRLFLVGGHPYSSSQVLAVERFQGWPWAQPLVMLCPPWTLPVFSIFSSLPFHLAHTLWYFLSIALDATSALALWHCFGGSRKRAWIALAVAATFVPMIGAELLGQVTPLILASLAPFILLLRRRYYFGAGILSFGLGIKPHLLYLVVIAALIWMVRTRCWKLLLGATVTYSALIFIAVLHNPASFDYFGESYSAAIETSCGIGGALRSVFGMQHVWLQFLPTAVGFSWFGFYCWRIGGEFDWTRDLPILTLVSVASSPYSWYHDYILIMPAIISLAVLGASNELLPLIGYLGVQMIIFRAGSASKAWMAAASALWIVFYFWVKSEHFDELPESPAIAP